MNADELIEDWSRLWIPPEKLTLSQWAEKNFVLSPEYSAKTGTLELFGWQREIFDSFTDPAVNKIVLKVGTQLVKTLFIQAAVAYIVAEAPGPVLLVQPKDPDAETFSKERLSPMIRDNPTLYEKLPDGKSPLNTITYKQFPGGSLTLVGSIVPGNMARRSIQYFFCDEVNKYPASAGGEGSPLRLGEERTATFGTRAKIIYTCSPTDANGVISREYEATDQRKPWVRCHHCDHSQILNWDNVRWSKTVAIDDRPATARYYCEQCDTPWNDVQRWRAAEGAEWIGDRAFTGAAGFWISHLYSPHKTLAKMVKAWLDADATNDVNEIKVFKNTNLAEDWKQAGEAPEAQRLYERREAYQIGKVPAQALFLTAGADVQKDRLEISIYGWGRGKESWLVDHIVLDGFPTQTQAVRLESGTVQRPVWDRLTEVLNSTYPHESGADLSILRLGIDSGYCTHEVYAWARQQGSARVLALDPHGRETAAIVGQPSPVDVTVGGRKIKRGVKVWPVAVSRYKHEFYGWLKLDKPESGIPCHGYCHYPEMPLSFFQQLTAEQLIEKPNKGGFPVSAWHKTGPNEALDVRNYARACAAVVGIDRFTEQNWKTLERQIGVGAFVDSKVLPEAQLSRPAAAPAQQQIAPPVVSPQRRKQTRKVVRSNWMD